MTGSRFFVIQRHAGSSGTGIPQVLEIIPLSKNGRLESIMKPDVTLCFHKIPVKTQA
jgi:hypothetical protein